MYVCKAGHMAIRKARQGKNSVGKKSKQIPITSILKKCKHCPFKEGCYKEGAKSKNLFSKH